MKILITSYAYAPSVGGIETVSKLMAEAFAARGHEVVIATDTPADNQSEERLKIIRRPSPGQLWKVASTADLVWQNNISLKYLWAPLLQGKPIAVTLACPIYTYYPKKRLRERLKAFLLRYCRVFAISRYVLNDMGYPYEMIGNPYDSSIHEDARGISKDRDIVFVGRLVSDKGVDLLIEALAKLNDRGLRPTCSIIGDGPERNALEKAVERAGLTGHVQFRGILKGAALHREVARHRIMAVPSRWKEPFGVVALEGIAAGCFVVGSAGGGLCEAIGPCGITFENGDIDQLTAALEKGLELTADPVALNEKREKVEAHLSRFTVEAQADHYLRVFEEMLK